jgi:hypothetical protein
MTWEERLEESIMQGESLWECPLCMERYYEGEIHMCDSELVEDYLKFIK